MLKVHLVKGNGSHSSEMIGAHSLTIRVLQTRLSMLSLNYYASIRRVATFPLEHVKVLVMCSFFTLGSLVLILLGKSPVMCAGSLGPC